MCSRTRASVQRIKTPYSVKKEKTQTTRDSINNDKWTIVNICPRILYGVLRGARGCANLPVIIICQTVALTTSQAEMTAT